MDEDQLLLFSYQVAVASVIGGHWNSSYENINTNSDLFISTQSWYKERDSSEKISIMIAAWFFKKNPTRISSEQLHIDIPRQYIDILSVNGDIMCVGAVRSRLSLIVSRDDKRYDYFERALNFINQNDREIYRRAKLLTDCIPAPPASITYEEIEAILNRQP